MAAISSSQIDKLAIAFTVFASLWLLVAVLYMTTVCLFFRMRSRGALRGSMSSPAWGRVYLWPNSRYYIPMGWLFRRYIMYQRSGEERERIAKIRVMSVEERRAAVEVILKAPRNQETNNNIATAAPSSAAPDGEASPTTDPVRELSTLDAIGDGDPANETGSGDPQPFQTEERHASPTYLTTAYHNDNDDSDEAPFDERFEDVGLAPSVGDDAPLTTTTVSTKNTEHAKMAALAAAAMAANEDASSSSSSLSLGGSDDTTHCPICFAEYTEDNPHFDSPVCSHRFHWECILSWLEFQSHRDCPCCRVELVNEEQIWRVVRQMRKNERRKQRRKEEANNGGDDTEIRRGATEDEDDELSRLEEGSGGGGRRAGTTGSALAIQASMDAVDSDPQNRENVEVINGSGDNSSMSNCSVIAFDEHSSSSNEGQLNNRRSQDILRSSSEPVHSGVHAQQRDHEDDVILVRSQSDVIMVRSRSNPVDLDVSNNSDSLTATDNGNNDDDEESQIEVLYDMNRHSEEENPTLARFLAASAHVSDI